MSKRHMIQRRVVDAEENRQMILQGLEGPEKAIGKLKHRHGVYKKWIAKLKVTKALVNERKNWFEKNFRKITAVTGIGNPNDIEGLLSFIERTNDLRKTKVVRERKLDHLKLERTRLEDELKNYEEGKVSADPDSIQI